MQPGETITPGASPQPPSDQSVAPVSPAPDNQWQYRGDADKGDQVPPPHDLPSVTWTASEYVAHPKGIGWFGAFGVAIAVLSIVIFLATKDVLTVILVAVAGIAFGAFAARNPQVLTYRIDSQGLTIGEKHYPYAMFKSFAVVEEGPISSLVFAPLKRFSTPIVVYYDRKDEEKIAGTLSNYLPVEDRGHDMVDRLMRRVRF